MKSSIEIIGFHFKKREHAQILMGRKDLDTGVKWFSNIILINLKKGGNENE